VRGYGEYQNFYRPDMMCIHARIEIFCRASEADAIADCIMDAAHTGLSGDGMVAVLPGGAPLLHTYQVRARFADAPLSGVRTGKNNERSAEMRMDRK
jgi:nitrogen regulatory protein PII